MFDARHESDEDSQAPIPEALPYTPPEAASAPPTSPAVPAMPYATAYSTGGVWRDGKFLVVHRTAELPDFCVKSGAPAEGYKLKRKLTWHHPAIYLIILANLLIYIIVALIVQQRAVIHIGLSRRYRRRRRNAILFGWLGCLGSIALTWYLFASDHFAAGFAGVPAFLVCLIVAHLMARMVVPRRIDRGYIWLRGVSPKALAMFPQWPYH